MNVNMAFAIKSTCVRILDFIFSGRILYTKVSRMIFFWISLLTNLFLITFVMLDPLGLYTVAKIK